MKKLMSLDQLTEGQSKGISVDGQELFVVCKDQQYFAYINSCPHIGIALEFMPDQFLDADAELIVCSSHGALFEIQSGKCVAGPCIGESLQPIKLHSENGQLFWQDHC